MATSASRNALQLEEFIPSKTGFSSTSLSSSSCFLISRLVRVFPRAQCNYSLALAVIFCSVFALKSCFRNERTYCFSSKPNLYELWLDSHVALLFSIKSELSLPTTSSEAEQWQTTSHKTFLTFSRTTSRISWTAPVGPDDCLLACQRTRGHGVEG